MTYRHSDSHLWLCDGIHGRWDKGRLQGDFSGQGGRKILNIEMKKKHNNFTEIPAQPCQMFDLGRVCFHIQYHKSEDKTCVVYV